MLCGNNEVSQQAAMMSMPAEARKSVLFDRLLRDLSFRTVPGVPYLESSPSGGTMPFYNSDGPSHYFGVGAYLRPLEDARFHRVRFASECLAFANVPEGAHARGAVPRDAGAGWDFGDVTDHYVERLFGVDPIDSRYVDQERHLAYCRATTCEVMSRVQGMWRAQSSTCRGALVWLFRDVEEGSGWGVVDHLGVPKSAYYGLKRAWAPLGLWIVDEGLDGLAVHAENDRATPVTATLEVELYRKDGLMLEHAKTNFELGAREQRVFSVDGLIGRFVDSSYAYRFGPPAHTMVAARLRDAAGDLLAQAFHLPLGLERTTHDVQLSATATKNSGGTWTAKVVAQRIALFVAIDVPGYLPSDNYFHLAPKVPWTVVLTPATSAPPQFSGRVRSLNSPTVRPIHHP
jgi:beta-mannosidase